MIGYFTILILIHELGHSLTAIILGYKLNSIKLYPFGGLSVLDYPINIKNIKEFLILISGPLTQILFTFLIYYLDISVLPYFYTYSLLILLFNLLPIYPLDGGKLLYILYNYIFPYYKAIKYTYITSYILLISISLYLLILYKNLIILFIFISLFIEYIRSLHNSKYLFKRFILERILYNFNFKKYKIINNIYSMKKDYNHIFYINKYLINEKEYLKNNKV